MDNTIFELQKRLLLECTGSLSFLDDYSKTWSFYREVRKKKVAPVEKIKPLIVVEITRLKKSVSESYFTEPQYRDFLLTSYFTNDYLINTMGRSIAALKEVTCDFTNVLDTIGIKKLGLPITGLATSSMVIYERLIKVFNENSWSPSGFEFNQLVLKKSRGN